MKNFRVVLAGLMLIGLSACQRSPETGNAMKASSRSPAPSYATLAPGLQKLKTDFNSHVDSVRLVYIVGATCPECLHGMAVLGNGLRAEQDNPRLRTYVVYVPALGATAKDIQPTIGLIRGNHVDRYWDPRGATGRTFENVLGIGQFAWDVYMIYAPGQTWDVKQPPQPRFWMDQPDGLPSGRFLNADVFASQVKRALASSASGTPSSRGL